MWLLFFCLCPSMSHWSIHWFSKAMEDFLLYHVSKGNRWGGSVWSLSTNKHANSGYPTLMNKPAVVTLYWWMGQWWSSYTDSKWADSGHPALMNRPTVVTLRWWMGHWWSPYTVELAIGDYPILMDHRWSPNTDEQANGSHLTLMNWPLVVTPHWLMGHQWLPYTE